MRLLMALPMGAFTSHGTSHGISIDVSLRTSHGSSHRHFDLPWTSNWTCHGKHRASRDFPWCIPWEISRLPLEPMNKSYGTSHGIHGIASNIPWTGPWEYPSNLIELPGCLVPFPTGGYMGFPVGRIRPLGVPLEQRGIPCGPWERR